MLSYIDEPAAEFNHSGCVRMQQNGGNWVTMLAFSERQNIVLSIVLYLLD